MATALDELLARQFVHEGDVVIDGGSYNGDTALEFFHAKASHVYLVDPFQKPLLTAFLEYEPPLRYRPSFCVVQAALSDSDGFMAMHVSKRHDYGSSLYPHRIACLFPGLFGEVGERQIEMVPTVRMDTLWHNERVDVIKLDCEGAEPEALLGAEGLYSRPRHDARCFSAPRVTICELFEPVREEGLSLLRSYHDHVMAAYSLNNASALMLTPLDMPLPAGADPHAPMYVGWNGPALAPPGNAWMRIAESPRRGVNDLKASCCGDTKGES